MRLKRNETRVSGHKFALAGAPTLPGLPSPRCCGSGSRLPGSDGKSTPRAGRKQQEANGRHYRHFFHSWPVLGGLLDGAWGSGNGYAHWRTTLLVIGFSRTGISCIW